MLLCWETAYSISIQSETKANYLNSYSSDTLNQFRNISWLTWRYKDLDRKLMKFSDGLIDVEN